MVSLTIIFLLGTFAVVGLALVVGGIAIAYYGRRFQGEASRMEETETTPAGNVEPGEVEVKGTARPIEGAGTVEGHLSETEALVSTVYIEERGNKPVQDWEQTEGRSKLYRTVYKDTAAVPFLVDDGTGEVLVDPATEGNIALEEDQQVVGRNEEAPTSVRRFVERTEAIDPDQVLDGGRRRRFSEGLLEPGEEVYVLGEAVDPPDRWGEYEVSGGSNPDEFILSDRSEEELTAGSKLGAWMTYALGGVVVGTGVLFVLTAVVLAGFFLL